MLAGLHQVVEEDDDMGLLDNVDMAEDQSGHLRLVLQKTNPLRWTRNL